MDYEARNTQATIPGAISRLIAGVCLFSLLLGPGFVIGSYILSAGEWHDPWQRLVLVFVSLLLHMLAFSCAMPMAGHDETGRFTNSTAATVAAALSLAAAAFTYWALAAFFPVFFPYTYA